MIARSATRRPFHWAVLWAVFEPVLASVVLLALVAAGAVACDSVSVLVFTAELAGRAIGACVAVDVFASIVALASIIDALASFNLFGESKGSGARVADAATQLVKAQIDKTNGIEVCIDMGTPQHNGEAIRFRRAHAIRISL